MHGVGAVQEHQTAQLSTVKHLAETATSIRLGVFAAPATPLRICASCTVCAALLFVTGLILGLPKFALARIWVGSQIQIISQSFSVEPFWLLGCFGLCEPFLRLQRSLFSRHRSASTLFRISSAHSKVPRRLSFSPSLPSARISSRPTRICSLLLLQYSHPQLVTKPNKKLRKQLVTTTSGLLFHTSISHGEVGSQLGGRERASRVAQ